MYQVPPDVIHKEGNVAWMVLPKMHNLKLILRKHQISTNGCILQNNLPVLIENVKVTRDKERLRNSSRLKKTKEITVSMLISYF